MKQYVLITGASGGIGASLALKFAKEGYNLILIGRNVSKLDNLSYIITRAYNINAITYQVDLSSPEHITRLVNKLKKANLNITIVINNAGVGSFGEFKNIDATKDLEIINVNVQATTLLLKEIIPLLNKHSHIVQVASTAAFTPGPYMAVYYASKAYVLSLSLALRHELKKDNIHVSVLCPGPTISDFQTKAGMKKAKFTNLIIMHPTKVANIAYKGIRANKSIIITGFANKLLLQCMNFIPYNAKSSLTAKSQKIV
ncbi:MAG: hypothetical protein ATN33_06765 [Epulopiscium sp. Nele67-Bin001]|nr:MAG: hypothetical protein BEN18_07715 [Epulopiscium sp. Nuni2H_MBin001]OON92753.1 MAG: hypothetical protein ATN33_06765 [Epulopiscium sp. Nele67-Bin001]